MHRVERVEFYYSSEDEPLPKFSVNLEEVFKLLDELAKRGVDAEAIDVSKVRDITSIYHRAISGNKKPSVLYEDGLSFEDWGRKVPILLFYRHANDRVPFDVFPRLEAGKIVGVEEALKKLLESE